MVQWAHALWRVSPDWHPTPFLLAMCDRQEIGHQPVAKIIRHFFLDNVLLCS